MLTFQEMFDIIYVGLLKQNKPSTNGGLCAYRGENDTKCAVGFLIKDGFYNSFFEGGIISADKGAINSGLLSKDETKRDALFKALKNSGVDIDNTETLSFLEQIQLIHDCFGVNNWKSKLESLAIYYDLNVPKID